MLKLILIPRDQTVFSLQMPKRQLAEVQVMQDKVQKADNHQKQQEMVPEKADNHQKPTETEVKAVENSLVQAPLKEIHRPQSKT